jgi:P-type Cu+ transporter
VETTKDTTLHIAGMDCNTCALSITSMLKKKGLPDAQVNFATGEAVFHLPGNIKIEEVKADIEGMGYKVFDKPGEEIQPKFSLQLKLILSAIFTLPLLLHMVPGITFLDNRYVQLALSLPVVVIGTLHFGRSAWGSLKNLFPNMDVLIFTGFSAAFIYSLIGTFSPQTQEHAHKYLFYETAASIITLVLLGNFIEHKAVKKTASSVDGLIKLKPLMAKLIMSINNKEKILETEIKNIKAGDVVLVVTGDRIPADGKIIDGTGLADQSMFTGESEPAVLDKGKTVIGGSVLTDGNIKVKVETTGEDAYLSKLIELVKKASFSKPKIQQLGDKVSAVFVPVVIAISIVTFFAAKFVFHVDTFHSVMNAVAVLVISCPCAMGLATPTAVMAGIGRSARQGILIKGGDTLQILAEAKHMLFDKTGTLTTGDFKISKLESHAEFSNEEIRGLIFTLEQHSVHPIARAIVKELDKDKTDFPLEKTGEIKGIGIKGWDKNKNEFYLGSERILPPGENSEGARLFLLQNEKLIARIWIEDEIKGGSRELTDYLNEKNIESTIISGDVEEKCRQVAEKTGIKKYFASLLPHQKLEKIEDLKKTGYVVMVGDGINDAPSLTAAHTGISFANATDIAIQSANVIIINNSAEKIKEAHLLAKHTLRTIKQNLFWAFCYNAVAIPLAAMGYLNPMWGAAFMAFSDIMVIGNSVRLNYKKLN